MLNIIVIGAGIAGLTAALALRQAGHKVTVIEKSAFATEIGAAIALSPNGAYVLSHLGFDFKRARADVMPSWEAFNGISLARLGGQDLTDAPARYAGHPLRAVHRVDLHSELLRLAAATEEEQEVAGGDHRAEATVTAAATPPVRLRLASPVASVDAAAGSVQLADGTLLSADLIVGADGLSSVARRAVMGDGAVTAHTGKSAFRLLVPTGKYESDPALAALREWKIQGGSTVVDVTDLPSNRHIVWYTCRDRKVQNVIGIHPTRPNASTEDAREALMDEFSHFHPDLLKLMQLGEAVNHWELVYYDPLPKWTTGKLVLIGDAAHPMLPTGGQAGNQAMEDAGALATLLQDVASDQIVSQRLALFEKVRRNRAATMQILSSVQMGRELDAKDRLVPYTDEGESAPTNFAERLDQAYRYNVITDCEQALSELRSSTSSL